jgi:parallel beta-helix repeat (two copies)
MVLLIVLLPSFALAAKTPISGPTTIIQPGSYYLTKDIAAPQFSQAITIEADHVTIDLDGHVMTSTHYDLISCTNHTDIRITNGKMVGGGVGISFQHFGGRIEIDHMTFVGQTGLAIFIYPVNAERHPYGTAIIEDVFVDSTGIEMEYLEGGLVDRNVLHKAYMRLINCRNNTLSNNDVSGYSTMGIGLFNSENNLIHHNNVSGVVSTGGIYLDNTSNNNSLDWNLAAQNGGEGIHIAGTGNVYSYNRTPGNAFPGIGAAVGNTDGGGNFP